MKLFIIVNLFLATLKHPVTKSDSRGVNYVICIVVDYPYTCLVKLKYQENSELSIHTYISDA